MSNILFMQGGDCGVWGSRLCSWGLFLVIPALIWLYPGRTDLFLYPFSENGRICTTAGPRHIRVAGGTVPGPGSGVCGADRRVDGPLQGRVCLGRFGAAVQRAPSLHGVGPRLPARRWWVHKHTTTLLWMCPFPLKRLVLQVWSDGQNALKKQKQNIMDFHLTATICLLASTWHVKPPSYISIIYTTADRNAVTAISRLFTERCQNAEECRKPAQLLAWHTHTHAHGREEKISSKRQSRIT